MHKEILESLEILERCALDEIIRAENSSDRNYWLGRAVGFKLAMRVIDSEEN